MSRTLMLVLLSVMAMAGDIEIESDIMSSKITLEQTCALYIIKVTNKTSEKIELQSVEKGCGCIAFDISEKDIAVNGRGEVIVMYTPSSFINVAEKKVILIVKAGDQIKKIPITLRATAEMPYAIAPTSICCKALANDEEKIITVGFDNGVSGGIDYVGVSEGYSVKFNRIDNHYKISVTPVRPLREGAIIIRFHGVPEKFSTITLPISVN